MVFAICGMDKVFMLKKTQTLFGSVFFLFQAVEICTRDAPQGKMEKKWHKVQ